MLRSDIEKVIVILRENNGPENVILDFEQMLQSYNGEEFDLINKKRYIATILWTEEDVVQALKEQCYDPTEENIGKVLSYLSVRALEDCSDGWEAIYQAISQALESSKTDEVFKTINVRLETSNETMQLILPIEPDMLEEIIDELKIDSVDNIDFEMITHLNKSLFDNQNVFTEDGLKHYLSNLSFIGFDFIKSLDFSDFKASSISTEIFNKVLNQLELTDEETFEGILIEQKNDKLTIKAQFDSNISCDMYRDIEFSDLVNAF